MIDYIERIKKRKKKLDIYHDEILSWLEEFNDITAAQVYDWLREKHGDIKVCESSVRNYMIELRDIYSILKTVKKRQYEAIKDSEKGKQMQVDFGYHKAPNNQGGYTKLWFIAFVLSNSRYKYGEWLDRPFTTHDVIIAHKRAYNYFSGMTEEIVYDQDHLITVNENNGDIILTEEFKNYVKLRKFKIHLCRKNDPESKVRIENVIGFIKHNFANHRRFDNIDKYNERFLRWLDRTGDYNVHHSIKKRPVEENISKIINSPSKQILNLTAEKRSINNYINILKGEI